MQKIKITGGVPIITNIIRQTINEFNTPFNEINHGECRSFALEIQETLEGLGLECELLSDGLFYDCFGDEEPELLFNPADYGSKKPENFEDVGLPAHYWIYYKGKHFDCEAPEGVKNLFDLPIVKKFYKEKA